MAKWITILSNEPYCHTPADILDMTFAEIWLILSKHEPEKSLTMHDQDRVIREFRERKAKEQSGIWDQKGMW